MNYKWRDVKETLLTFMFSKNVLNEYRNNIRMVGEKINDPFEKPLHDIYSKEKSQLPTSPGLKNKRLARIRADIPMQFMHLSRFCSLNLIF